MIIIFACSKFIELLVVHNDYGFSLDESLIVSECLIHGVKEIEKCASGESAYLNHRLNHFYQLFFTRQDLIVNCVDLLVAFGTWGTGTRKSTTTSLLLHILLSLVKDLLRCRIVQAWLLLHAWGSFICLVFYRAVVLLIWVFIRLIEGVGAARLNFLKLISKLNCQCKLLNTCKVQLSVLLGLIIGLEGRNTRKNLNQLPVMLLRNEGKLTAFFSDIPLQENQLKHVNHFEGSWDIPGQHLLRGFAHVADQSLNCFFAYC